MFNPVILGAAVGAALAGLFILMTPVKAAEPECKTLEYATTFITAIIPDAEVEAVFEESNIVIFAAASQPTKLELTFDDEGCLVSQRELPKISS
jgi:hypothetical protein